MHYTYLEAVLLQHVYCHLEMHNGPLGGTIFAHLNRSQNLILRNTHQPNCLANYVRCSEGTMHLSREESTAKRRTLRGLTASHFVLGSGKTSSYYM